MRVKDLTSTQLKLLKLMLQNEYELVCNEGANYKCWLEDKEGNRISQRVRTDTGNTLVRDGWLEGYDKSGVRGARFYHRLTSRGTQKLTIGY